MENNINKNEDTSSNKVIVLIEENPQLGTFEATGSRLGLYFNTQSAIDPMHYLAPESHALGELYKDVFTEQLANELLAYLISKHPQALVYDIIEDVYASQERLILVNTTILTSTDVDFLIELFEGYAHMLTYRLLGDVETDAKTIYDASKRIRP